MRLFWISLMCGVLTQGALAQQSEDGNFRIGQDAFSAGQTVIHDGAETDDLFIAGQNVGVESAVNGSVHAAGQTVTIRGRVGGNLYAAGQDVTLSDEVAGNVTVFGQTIRLDGPMGADLRAAGARVTLNAPVAGYAILAGQTIDLNAEIAGDVSLAAENTIFGEGARITGRLTLYEESVGEMEVPELVVPGDRITRREIKDWEQQEWRYPGPTWGDLLGRFVAGVVAVSLLAALIAAIMPERLADMRRTMLAEPFRTLGIGFVAESALIGSIFLVAITLVGLLLVPAILLIAGLATVAGYVIGAYAFGVGLLLLAGRMEPDSLAERAIAAGIGALTVAILGLIPILGWIFVLALSLTGVGAIFRGIRHHPTRPTLA